MRLDFLFVSNTSRSARPFYDPSVRYRCVNVAEYLRRRGYAVALLAQSEFEKYADQFTDLRLAVFHRPIASETTLRYVRRQTRTTRLVVDYDDLVFDVTSVKETPAVKDRREEVTKVARAVAANAEIGQLFNLRTCSTYPLGATADKVLGGKSIVIHNAIDPMYADIAKSLLGNLKSVVKEYDLGYFSGTASHNADLESIAPEIAQHLREDRERTFLLVGPVAIPSVLKPLKEQISQLKIVSFYEMPLLLAKCRMVLGPLLRNNFTHSKSGLKFFEAAALGVQVAATPIPDVDRFESKLLHRSCPQWWCNSVEQAAREARP